MGLVQNLLPATAGCAQSNSKRATCNSRRRRQKKYCPNTPTEKREKCQGQTLNAKYYEHFLAALSPWPNRIRTAPCEKICAAKRLFKFFMHRRTKSIFAKYQGNWYGRRKIARVYLLLLLLLRPVSTVCFKSQLYMEIKSCLSRTYLGAIVINIHIYLHARSGYANGALSLVYRCVSSTGYYRDITAITSIT